MTSDALSNRTFPSSRRSAVRIGRWWGRTYAEECMTRLALSGDLHVGELNRLRKEVRRAGGGLLAKMSPSVWSFARWQRVMGRAFVAAADHRLATPRIGLAEKP